MIIPNEIVSRHMKTKIPHLKEKFVVTSFLILTFHFPLDLSGYCFAKCQQQFAACLLAQIHQVVSGSIDYCDHMSKTCEKNCLNDKRTSRIAETNWDKVAKILQQFNSYSSPDNTEKH